MAILCGRIISLDSNFGLIDIPDGAIVFENGCITDVGSRPKILKRFPQEKPINGDGCILLPGFVDCHLHFPQYEVIASYGEELLGWLNKYTFPIEASFANPRKAENIAKLFADQLVRNGTTCASIFSTSHYEATRKLFQVLDERGMRALVGKVAMDRNCPDALKIPAPTEFENTVALIEEFDGLDGRLHYVLTPRFAPTSSEKLLETMSRLHNRYPHIPIQTHFAENIEELNWVQELFKKSKNYLDVYDHYGLLGKKTLLAHAIHVSDLELARIVDTKTKIVHCPTSNLFLGSGMFPMKRYNEFEIPVALGSDVGGGTSFSMWQTLSAAYGIQKLLRKNLSPKELFSLATIAGAKSLGLDHKIGTLEKGKSCDIQVINPNRNKLLAHRLQSAETPEEILFALCILGDERIHEMTLVEGNVVHCLELQHETMIQRKAA